MGNEDSKDSANSPRTQETSDVKPLSLTPRKSKSPREKTSPRDGDSKSPRGGGDSKSPREKTSPRDGDKTDKHHHPFHFRHQKLDPEEEKRIQEEKEKEALAILTPLYPNTTQDDLLRFLRARNCNIQQSTEMYNNYLKWCAEFKPDECDDKLFREQIEKGKFYCLTMEGEYPILYFVGREHESDRDDYKEVVKFGCYVYELIIHSLGPRAGSAQFIALVNCNDTGWKNVDRKLIQAGIGLIQDCYPERLCRCYIYGMPPALVSIWNFVEKLLDERTRGKLILLKKSHHEDIFAQYPKELIPSELGGTNDKVVENSKKMLIQLHEKRLAELQSRDII